MDLISLPETDEQLLEECEVQTYRSSGKGGQHVNKTESAVRLIHIPSGITVTCQEERSQHLNRKRCIEKLRAKVKKVNYRPPPRKPTKEPRWVKEKVLTSKKKQSEKKLYRKKPDIPAE